MSDVVDGLMSGVEAGARFEVTRHLQRSIENISSRIETMLGAQATRHDETQRIQMNILERLAAVEANRQFQDRVERQVATNQNQIDSLITDMQRRQGANGVYGVFFKYAPHLWAAAVSAVLLGRVLGLVHFPGDAPQLASHADITVITPVTKKD